MTPEENQRLTRVSSGTPCGDMLRRYWWPVALSEGLGTKPLGVRVLGEDLVLFRDGAGKTGLVDRACAHRGASLELGRVESDGIRCCYHGWKFATDGSRIEMPAEPPGSRLNEEVRQRAYPTEEAGGLVFAYLGPQPLPLMPRYDLLFQPGMHRVVHGNIDHCNWLQRAENSVDQLHATVLHAPGYPELALKRADVDWRRTAYGIRASYAVDGGQGKVSHYIFPSSNRYFGARVGDEPSHNLHVRTPRDDTSTMTFGVRAYLDPEGRGSLKTHAFRIKQRGVYEQVDDDWWGIASRDQDRAAQESQGLIADRSREFLATSDQGVVMMRRMLSDAIDAVARGEDPPGVMRQPTEGYIDFDASQHRDGVLLRA